MAAKKLHVFRNISLWISLSSVAILLVSGCELQEIDFIEPTPIALQVKELTSTSFVASWKGVLGSTGYQVDVSTDPQFSFFVSGYKSKEVDSLNLLVTGLSTETQYYYRVRAKKGQTISDNSNVINVITKQLPAPVALSATDIRVFQFTANWEQADEATGYLVEVATDPDFTNVLSGYNNVETDSLSLAVTGLTAETSYYYRIRVKKEKAVSGYSNVIDVSTEPLPAPLALPATNSKVFQFTANWEGVDEAATYIIEVATNPEFTNTLAAYSGIEVLSDSLKVLDLDFRETYYYRLKSKRLEKESAFSNTIEVKPVISESCKLSKMSNAYSEINFDYDVQGWLSKISADFQGYLVEHQITYTNDTRVEEVLTYDGGEFTNRDRFTYNDQGQMLSLDRYDASGQFLFHTDYLYNDSKQIVGFRQYEDEAKTILAHSEDYKLDTHGNVLEVYDINAEKIGEYRYDDKFNPKMLIIRELHQYIPDDFSGFNYRIVQGLYNPVYANVYNYYYDFLEQEVFIYDYNVRDVALGRKGYYLMTYEFTGCDF